MTIFFNQSAHCLKSCTRRFPAFAQLPQKLQERKTIEKKMFVLIFYSVLVLCLFQVLLMFLMPDISSCNRQFTKFTISFVRGAACESADRGGPYVDGKEILLFVLVNRITVLKISAWVIYWWKKVNKQTTFFRIESWSPLGEESLRILQSFAKLLSSELWCRLDCVQRKVLLR